MKQRKLRVGDVVEVYSGVPSGLLRGGDLFKISKTNGMDRIDIIPLTRKISDLSNWCDDGEFFILKYNFNDYYTRLNNI